MGLGEASASCGQDKQSAEDVRQVPVGLGQDITGPLKAGCMKLSIRLLHTFKRNYMTVLRSIKGR